jgi:hypothetical protein
MSASRRLNGRRTRAESGLTPYDASDPGPRLDTVRMTGSRLSCAGGQRSSEASRRIPASSGPSKARCATLQTPAGATSAHTATTDGAWTSVHSPDDLPLARRPARGDARVGLG